MREVQFDCPICKTDMRLPETQAHVNCPNCNVRLDVVALLAFLRGLEAFDEGQDLILDANPRKLRRWNNPNDRRAVLLFREAYSSLQIAFEGYLVEEQRQLALEMMASLAQEFSARSMVSAYEGQYWRAAMAELTSQNEYHDLKKKLRFTRKTVFNFPMRWYWGQRQKQLLNVLKELNRKLTLLEEQIEFIELPKARNRNWKP